MAKFTFVRDFLFGPAYRAEWNGYKVFAGLALSPSLHGLVGPVKPWIDPEGDGTHVWYAVRDNDGRTVVASREWEFAGDDTRAALRAAMRLGMAAARSAHKRRHGGAIPT